MGCHLPTKQCVWSPVYPVFSVCSHLGILCSMCMVTFASCAQWVWLPVQSVLSACGHMCILCLVYVVTLCVLCLVHLVTCTFCVQCIWSTVCSIFSAFGHLCILCSVYMVTLQCVLSVCGHLVVCIQCVWSPVQFVFSVCGHLFILCSTVLLFTLRWDKVSAQVSTERRVFCGMLYPKIPTCQIILKQPQIIDQVGHQHNYSQSIS